MRKSLGDKRREIPLDRAQDILKILADFSDGDTRTVTKDGKEEEVVVSRIFPTTHFGFRKITVERPLRLNFQASPERIARLEEEKGFQALAQSKKKGAAGAKEQAEGRALQEAIRDARARAARTRSSRTATSSSALLDAAAAEGRPEARRRRPARRSSPPSRSATRPPRSAATRTATPSPTRSCATPRACRSSESVEAFFEREVKPHVPDAWIDTAKRDPKDGQVGLVGYEINFNRYFYRYTPPRPLEEIEADIRGIETDIMRMLAEVTGGPARRWQCRHYREMPTALPQLSVYETKCRDLCITPDVLYHLPTMAATPRTGFSGLIGRWASSAPPDLEAHGIPRAQLYRLVRRGSSARRARASTLADRRPDGRATLAQVAKRSGRRLLPADRAALPRADDPVAGRGMDRAPEKARKPRLDYRASACPVLRRGPDRRIETHRMEGVDVRVYSAAKTVADCFKYRNKVGIDVAVEALRDFSRRHRGGATRLARFARICRVDRVMQPYLDAIA